MTTHNPPYGNARSAPSSRSTWVRMHPAQTASAVVGAVFLLVGIAGFIPGLTTNVDDIKGAGNESTAELLGVFQVSVLHNVVHLAFGALGLLAARTLAASRLFLVGGGVIYLVLTLYGVVVDQTSDANFVPVNTADNWLHLVLGLGMIALGLLLGGWRRQETTAPTLP